MAKPTSILKNDRPYECFVCHQWGDIHLHHVFKGKNRKISDREGFVVHLCADCHNALHGKNGHRMDEYLMQTCQEEFEKTHTREEFMKLIGRNYLDD